MFSGHYIHLIIFPLAQTTVIAFFKYSLTGSKVRAFIRMGFPPLKTVQKKPEGLEFWKALGSGAGNGFSIKPDFSTYGLLAVFSSELQAERFIKGKLIEKYKRDSSSHSCILMHPVQAHGFWDKEEPFRSSANMQSGRPVCVITRATIKPRYAIRFWKDVPGVSMSLEKFDECIYSKGIGEWPVLMQATFSAWKNVDAMKSFAYKNREHHEVVKKTRELGWYSEELFARFHPIMQTGTLIPDLNQLSSGN